MNIVAKVSEMTNIKGNMLTCKSAVEEQNANMNKAIMQIRDYWNSTSGNALMAEYANVNAILVRMAETLGTGCTALQTAITQYTNTEQENKNMLNTAIGDITAPQNL